MIAEKLACEQVTAGDRTKENTANHEPGGNCAEKGAGRGGTGGGRECPPRPASLGSRRSRPFSSPFPSPYPATGACSQATEKRKRFKVGKFSPANQTAVAKLLSVIICSFRR